MPSIIEKELIKEFRDRDTFSRDDLYAFFRLFEPGLKKSTFTWKIYDLKNKRIIAPLTKKLFTLTDKSEFKPAIPKRIFNLANRISTKFEEIKYCIWDTEWLNEFSRHQAIQSKTIIEIEKDFVESLYYDLKDAGVYDLFLNPDEKEIDFYIAESEHPIILKSLISRSPLDITRKAKISTPQLEKILVDIYADHILFQYVQGAELSNIYKKALSKYDINVTTLVSYAKRRGKEDEIKAYLKEHLPRQLKDIV